MRHHMNKKFLIIAVLALLGAASCQENAGVEGVLVSWGDIDVRYPQTSVPVHQTTDRLELNGWRGERVFAY